MADNPNPLPKEGTVIPVTDTPHAPFIFYDRIAAMGHADGIINITLAAHRAWVGFDGLVTDPVVTAYLRGSVQAAIRLREAIDKALLLAAVPAGEGKAN